MLSELVKKNRSYRKFSPINPPSKEDLVSLVSLTRYTASAANRQPLRYMPITLPEQCARVFSSLHWASYLKDWTGPAEGERPTSYLILLSDPSGPVPAVDAGIAAQTILLGAVERGWGGCILGAIDRVNLTESLGLSAWRIELVIALGTPAETVEIVPSKDGEIHYYRTSDGVHHVPKLSLDEILLSSAEIS